MAESPAENPENSTVVIDGLKVLVVDDDTHLINVLDMYLKEMGCKPVLFTKGTDAVNYYAGNFNNIDIVLLDMIMPELSGQQVFRALRGININVIVAFMSGYNTNESMQALLNETNGEFLQKPFTFEQLRQSISNCVSTT